MPSQSHGVVARNHSLGNAAHVTVALSRCTVENLDRFSTVTLTSAHHTAAYDSAGRCWEDVIKELRGMCATFGCCIHFSSSDAVDMDVCYHCCTQLSRNGEACARPLVVAYTSLPLMLSRGMRATIGCCTQLSRNGEACARPLVSAYTSLPPALFCIHLFSNTR